MQKKLEQVISAECSHSTLAIWTTLTAEQIGAYSTFYSQYRLTRREENQLNR